VNGVRFEGIEAYGRGSLDRGIGGTAEEERLPTGSGQAGLDSQAERQKRPL
jgi:hypothetical protein